MGNEHSCLCKREDCIRMDSVIQPEHETKKRSTKIGPNGTVSAAQVSPMKQSEKRDCIFPALTVDDDAPSNETALNDENSLIEVPICSGGVSYGEEIGKTIGARNSDARYAEGGDHVVEDTANNISFKTSSRIAQNSDSATLSSCYGESITKRKEKGCNSTYLTTLKKRDLVGVSVHWLKVGFLDEVDQSGFRESANIYEIEDLSKVKHGVIRKKGATTVCPSDGKLGAAYVDCLTGHFEIC